MHHGAPLRSIKNLTLAQTALLHNLRVPKVYYHTLSSVRRLRCSGRFLRSLGIWICKLWDLIVLLLTKPGGLRGRLIWVDLINFLFKRLNFEFTVRWNRHLILLNTLFLNDWDMSLIPFMSWSLLNRAILLKLVAWAQWILHEPVILLVLSFGRVFTNNRLKKFFQNFLAVLSIILVIISKVINMLLKAILWLVWPRF